LAMQERRSVGPGVELGRGCPPGVIRLACRRSVGVPPVMWWASLRCGVYDSRKIDVARSRESGAAARLGWADDTVIIRFEFWGTVVGRTGGGGCDGGCEGQAIKCDVWSIAGGEPQGNLGLDVSPRDDGTSSRRGVEQREGGRRSESDPMDVGLRSSGLRCLGSERRRWSWR